MDASNAMFMSLDETSTEDLADDSSVLETTRQIWCQDTMQQAIWVFDPGKNELSSWSNYGLGTVCMANTSIGERRPVVRRSQTESEFVLQRVVGEVDEPLITPTDNDPPWVDVYRRVGGLESLVARTVWWNAMKPAGFEERVLQVTGEGNTLLSEWECNQARAEGGAIIGNIVPQKRCMEPSLLFSKDVGVNGVGAPSLNEETFLGGGERNFPTPRELEEAGRIPGTVLRLRGGGSMPRKRTK